jgi:hypothetical protein
MRIAATTAMAAAHAIIQPLPPTTETIVVMALLASAPMTRDCRDA